MMIEWFFQDEDNAQKLRAEAWSWAKPRTPFRMFSRAKGADGGVDCVGFLEEVTAAVGLERFSFPRSELDYSRHVHNNKILEHMRGKADNEASRMLAARWAEFEVTAEKEFTEKPIVGDIIVLKDGSNQTDQGVWHMPLMISYRKFLHCSPRLGVTEGNIDDPTYRNHLVAHFRARALPLTT